MEGTNEADELLFHALGEAIGRIWSTLPPAVQQQIFEEAVMSQGEAMRQKLAVFLHDKHSRTWIRLKSAQCRSQIALEVSLRDLRPSALISGFFDRALTVWKKCSSSAAAAQPELI